MRANNFESAKAFRLGMEAPTGGRIVKVTKDLIKLKSDKTGKIKTIPLYNDMPLNRGGFLDAKPVVKKGDRVEKGQLLADSNQTRAGRVSLGRNLITAIMPYYGHNYEDGTVISESAAKKLTSEHIYDLSQKLPTNATTSAGRFTTYGKRYKIDAENWAQLNKETGLIKPGSVVKKGDMLAQGILRRELN